MYFSCRVWSLPGLITQHLEKPYELHIRSYVVPFRVIIRRMENQICSIQLLVSKWCLRPDLKLPPNWSAFQEWINAFPILTTLEVIYEPYSIFKDFAIPFEFRKLVQKMRAEMPLISFTAPQLGDEDRYVNIF